MKSLSCPIVQCVLKCVHLSCQKSNSSMNSLLAIFALQLCCLVNCAPIISISWHTGCGVPSIKTQTLANNINSCQAITFNGTTVYLKGSCNGTDVGSSWLSGQLCSDSVCQLCSPLNVASAAGLCASDPFCMSALHYNTQYFSFIHSTILQHCAIPIN